MRRTTIPNSSFLIPHSRKAFIHNQWTEPPKGLTLNPLNLLNPLNPSIKKVVDKVYSLFFISA